jgi:tetratricopeptide (TPR) repeat protein
MITEGFGLYNTGKYAEANKAFDEAINASDEALKINQQLAQALYEKGLSKLQTAVLKKRGILVPVHEVFYRLVIC